MTQSNRPGSAPAAAVFDEFLVTLVQQGDRAALTRLHARWSPKLHRAAFRYTGDADQARDLTQESWLAIWKGIKRLKHPSRFRAFAFTILHRRGADYLRLTVRARQHFESDGDAESAADATQEDSVAIRQAFAQLPPDQRMAAHLHFIEGLTLAEIAEVQSVAQGTAKSRLFHARRKLKQALSASSPPSQGEQE